MRACMLAPAIVALALLTACSESSTPATTSTGAAQKSAPAAAAPAPAKPAATKPAAAEPGDLVAAGRAVYMGNCIACHNPNPALDGALGPAVSGSSQELLEARVILGTYPEGYTPKRGSGNMVPLPYLRDKIPALTAYLNADGG